MAEIVELREQLAAKGFDHVVLGGMGGSSLAPEVITAAAGKPLTVLDSTDPDMVRAAVSADLDRTIVVVSSKSGSTVETDSQRRAFVTAFAAVLPIHGPPRPAMIAAISGRKTIRRTGWIIRASCRRHRPRSSRGGGRK